MHIGTMIRYKQPDVLEKLHKKSKRKRRRDKQEHLSFNYIQNLMEARYILRDKKLDVKGDEIIMGMGELISWINSLIRQDNLKAFYNSALWEHMRKEILKEQHYECQVCKSKGLYMPAVTVHHIKFLREHPELALTKSNLMAVCEDCHFNIHHPHKIKWDDERW